MFRSAVVVPQSHPDQLHISMSDWCVQFSDTMAVVIPQAWGLLRCKIASAVVGMGLTQLFMMWEVHYVKSLIYLCLVSALFVLSVGWQQDGQKFVMAWERNDTESDKNIWNVEKFPHSALYNITWWQPLFKRYQP